MSDTTAAKRHRYLVLAGLLGFVSCCAFVRADAPSDEQPDLSVGAKEYPDADAIIIRWTESWTLHEDGSVTHRDHQWVKLMNTRPIGRFADPRIDFDARHDEVVIHTARAHLPNGEVLPVPDYGINIGAAGDVDGWPAYSDWQQYIVSFSGIEPGVTLELDYEVTTRAGTLPWMTGDIRLDDEYPVIVHRIVVTVPDNSSLAVSTAATGGPVQGGLTREHLFDWSFGPFAASPDEPHSQSWVDRSPRLRFSTTTPSQWVAKRLNAVSESAQADERIQSFAADVTKDVSSTEDRVRAVADRIKSGLNVVGSPKTMRECTCRPATHVLRDHYGSPLEVGALLLATCRALEIDASPMVAVDVDRWDGKTAVDGAFSGIVVAVQSDGRVLYVHPTDGVLDNPGRWGGHALLSIGEGGEVESMTIRRRGEEELSRLHIGGKLTVDKDGSVAGELHVRMTGAFYDPQSLESESDQHKAFAAVADHVSQRLSVDSHTIVTLSVEELVADLKVSTHEALPKAGDAFAFETSRDPVFLASFPLPLDRSSRKTAMELPGAFAAELDVTIEIPEAWSVRIAPQAVEKIGGPWGELSQSVEPEGNKLRLHRSVQVTSKLIEPAAFETLRDAVNELRATGSRLLVVGP